MSVTRTDSVLSVADLVDHPGASRRLAVDVDAPEEMALPLAEVAGPLRLDGVLESVVDGILVRGTLHIPLQLACARCLASFATARDVEVIELFTDPADAEDPADIEAGYAVHDGRIDLDTLLRDAVTPAVPSAPRCRPDCRGLCPTCGIDRNEADCDCVDSVTDRRWAALESLRLDPGAPPSPVDDPARGR